MPPRRVIELGTLGKETSSNSPSIKGARSTGNSRVIKAKSSGATRRNFACAHRADSNPSTSARRSTSS